MEVKKICKGLNSYELMKIKKTYEGYENLWRLRIPLKVKKSKEVQENLWRLRRPMKAKQIYEC